MTEQMRGQWVYDSEGRRARTGVFPQQWGYPPTLRDSPARRAWIARHAARDMARRNPHAALLQHNIRLRNILRRAELEARRRGPGEV